MYITLNQPVKLTVAGMCLAGLVACSEDGTFPTSATITIETDDTTDTAEVSDALAEAQSLLTALEDIGGTPFDVDNPVDFPVDYNVFIPSITGVDLNLKGDDNPSGPTMRIPMFEGRDPAGNPVDYIITEASDLDVANLMGLAYAPRMLAGANTPGAQNVILDNGIMEFPGTVDFSFTRSVTPGDPNATEGPNSVTRSEFPAAAVQPGAIADDEWSSLVVLPSGLVFNAQLVANATGIHDRIPDSTQDDQNNVNLDRTNRFVIFQLLDGWHAGDRYFYHIVTDSSVPDASSIELGVFAPRLAFLPAAGVFPDGARLGFSPNSNGLASGPDLPQGLNVSVTDQRIDPVNVFPISPADDRFSPMWDAHISQWTDEAIDNNLRRAITSIEDLASLIDDGLITNFVGNDGPENDFIAGLMPTNAIINCPVIMQPNESVINTTFGEFVN
ncbi:hypothetical protein OAM69_05775 [bacterium]|nr:hypothetical protein [bacterium]